MVRVCDMLYIFQSKCRCTAVERFRESYYLSRWDLRLGGRAGHAINYPHDEKSEFVVNQPRALKVHATSFSQSVLSFSFFFKYHVPNRKRLQRTAAKTASIHQLTYRSNNKAVIYRPINVDRPFQTLRCVSPLRWERIVAVFQRG